MSDQLLNTLVIILLTVIPLTFLLLQWFFSTRKRLFVSFIIPVLWTLLGAWMVIKGNLDGRGISSELIIFFMIGDLLFIGITLLVKYRKNKRNSNK